MSEKFASIEEKMLTIPTYEMGEEESLPVFCKLHINQGIKGDYYPYKSNDKLTMKLNPNHQYRAVVLENQYIKVTVLPELGGRIYEGYDKINDYNFVYKNNVIKPALIGLNGAWSSGGIEFNWPQHHRPTTFLPLDSTIAKEDDGSVTAWVGETEAMNGIKCLLGINLHPDKAYITAKAKIYNPTTQKQTFHWWANLAVHVDQSYKLMFPPDIDYITFHDKTHVSPFPYIKNNFAGADFGKGIDIRQYKNVESCSSFFIFNSQYNFMAGYDGNKAKGTVHVADKYVSPGKKFFTWGQSGYAKEWHNNLTDNDGEYIEIMTGCYTDNQPDFVWIMPQETKTFEQRWYSLNGLEDLKNATKDAAISIIKDKNGVLVQFNVTQEGTVELDVCGEKSTYNAVPGEMYTYHSDLAKEPEEAVVTIKNDKGVVLADYIKLPMYFDDKDAPTARQHPLPPQKINSVDELYANGMHLEQYKDPLKKPDPYYLEIIKRDPGDLRANTAMATLMYRRGDFEKAVPYLETAIKRATCRNPNPYDSDCYYQMGIVLKQMGQNKKAIEFLKRAAWQYSFTSASQLKCAEIEIATGDLENALLDLDTAIETNLHSLRARTLKSAVLLMLGRKEEAITLAEETVLWDILDSGSYFIKYLAGDDHALVKLLEINRDKTANYMDLAEIFMSAGMYEQALKAVELSPNQTKLLTCYKIYLNSKINKDYVTNLDVDSMPDDEIFPNRPIDFTVLEFITNNTNSAFAPYAIGCMLYARDTEKKAVEYWAMATKRNPNYADAYRALAQGLFEAFQDSNAAKQALKKAVELSDNPRVLYEYYQLLKVTGTAKEPLLKLINENLEIVMKRQDFVVQYIELLCSLGYYEKAQNLLDTGTFYTYEGGEGLTPQLNNFTHINLGNIALEKGDFEKAISEFAKANETPKHFHEGEKYQFPNAHRRYFIGKGYEAKGEVEKAKEAYEITANQPNNSAESQFFKALAHRKLGNYSAASEIFKMLKEEGERLTTRDTIEFFLRFPAALPYEQSQKRNILKIGYTAIAYGYIGLGEISEAEKVIYIMQSKGMSTIWLKLALNESNNI